MTTRAGVWVFLRVVAAVLCAFPAAALQAPIPSAQPPLVIKVGVDLIQIDASVTDRRGRPVIDLRAEEFILEVDGEKGVITNAAYFGSASMPINPGAAATPAAISPEGTPRATGEGPSTVVFLVDDLSMSAGSMIAAKEALSGFVGNWHEFNLRAALRTTSDATMTFPLYVAPERFAAAVQALKYNVNSAKGGLSTKSVQNDANITSHSMQEADPQELARFEQRIVSLTSTLNTLGAVPGRKALVFISEGLSLRDGVRPNDAPLLYVFRDTDAEGAYRSVAEVANRASVVVYTVDPRGLAVYEAGAHDGANAGQVSGLASVRRITHLEDQRTLQRIADDTGGLSTVNTNDIQAGLVGALRDQAAYYLIGFEPPKSAFRKAGGRPAFHKVRLTVSRPDLRVRTRAGFYGVTDADVNRR